MWFVSYCSHRSIPAHSNASQHYRLASFILDCRAVTFVSPGVSVRGHRSVAVGRQARTMFNHLVARSA